MGRRNDDEDRRDTGDGERTAEGSSGKGCRRERTQTMNFIHAPPYSFIQQSLFAQLIASAATTGVTRVNLSDQLKM